jgi:hypothetical protein
MVSFQAGDQYIRLQLELLVPLAIAHRAAYLAGVWFAVAAIKEPPAEPGAADIPCLLMLRRTLTQKLSMARERSEACAGAAKARRVEAVRRVMKLFIVLSVV